MMHNHCTLEKEWFKEIIIKNNITTRLMYVSFRPQLHAEIKNCLLFLNLVIEYYEGFCYICYSYLEL